MTFQGEVENITLTKEGSPEAIEVVNILAADEDRSATNTAERLIIQGGKERVEEIKKEKAEQSATNPDNR